MSYTVYVAETFEDRLGPTKRFLIWMDGCQLQMKLILYCIFECLGNQRVGAGCYIRWMFLLLCSVMFADGCRITNTRTCEWACDAHFRRTSKLMRSRERGNGWVEAEDYLIRLFRDIHIQQSIEKWYYYRRSTLASMKDAYSSLATPGTFAHMQPIAIFEQWSWRSFQ